MGSPENQIEKNKTDEEKKFGVDAAEVDDKLKKIKLILNK